jgi:hypothetical protein
LFLQTRNVADARKSLSQCILRNKYTNDGYTATTYRSSFDGLYTREYKIVEGGKNKNKVDEEVKT